MSIKRDFYKKHVDRRTRLRILIYSIILLLLIGLVMYDSFAGSLPFHYVLFVLGGWVLSFLLKKTQRATWDEESKKIIVNRNIIGWLIIVTVIVLRIFVFPRVLQELQVAMVSDAVFLIVIGWFLGRIRQFNEMVQEKAFSSFLEENQPNRINI